jgi:hypothetical protein
MAKWFFVSRVTEEHTEVPYEGIHEDDWRHGHYKLVTEKFGGEMTQVFPSSTSFREWQLAAERAAAWKPEIKN